MVFKTSFIITLGGNNDDDKSPLSHPWARGLLYWSLHKTGVFRSVGLFLTRGKSRELTYVIRNLSSLFR